MVSHGSLYVESLGSISATSLSVQSAVLVVLGNIEATRSVPVPCTRYTLDCSANSSTFDEGCDYPLHVDVRELQVRAREPLPPSSAPSPSRYRDCLRERIPTAARLAMPDLCASWPNRRSSRTE